VRRALLIAVLGCCALAGCGGGQQERPTVSEPPATVPADLLTQFDYDAAAPLDVNEVKSETKAASTPS
jgi:hypothetical protein